MLADTRTADAWPLLAARRKGAAAQPCSCRYHRHRHHRHLRYPYAVAEALRSNPADLKELPIHGINWMDYEIASRICLSTVGGLDVFVGLGAFEVSEFFEGFGFLCFLRFLMFSGF